METIDYENYEKIWQEEQDKFAKQFEWFIDIIKEEVTNIVGDFPELNIKISSKVSENPLYNWNKSIISVGINAKGLYQSAQEVFDIYLDENDQLVLFTEPFCRRNYGNQEPIKTLIFDPKPIFRDYVKQMIVLELVPEIKSWYKSNSLKNMPSKMKVEEKFDLSKITKEWFKEIFYEATENCSNGESAKKIKIKTTDTTILIEFAVDCGRRGIHKDNTVEINDRGQVDVYLCELLEGGGIEDELEEKIIDFIKK